jgi:peptidyl-prolyl cis-trans isomerase A (cyclophilin A)
MRSRKSGSHEGLRYVATECLMEEIVSKFSQRLGAILLLVCSVSLGMQLARGQVDQTDSMAPDAPLDEQEKILQEINAQSRRAFTPGPVDDVGPDAPRPKKNQFQPSVVETTSPQLLKQKDPRAVIKTSMGNITIRLFSTQAPGSVRNFIALAKGEKEFIDVSTSRKTARPYYDGMTFHKVVPGQYIQTGCPYGTGRGGPGYTISDEIRSTLNFDKPGMVAMAPQREGAKNRENTNGSQFFITLDSIPSWNEAYTIIGEVEKGMDVVRKIGKVDVGPTDRPIRKVYIESIVVLE